MSGGAARNLEASSILLLCDDRASHAPNVLEHIRSFQRFSRHRIELFNPRGLPHSRFLRLNDYDAVVVHYTAVLYLSPWFREQLAGFGGLKVQFIQDEYRRVDAMAKQMRELGIDLLFSSVARDALPSVYGSRLPGVDIVPTLTGFVPTRLERGRRHALDARPLDVGYRGRSIPYWLGRLGQEKALIGREFLARAASTDLRCDIAWSEADRIYGDAWYSFLGSARATLGTESGASIVDFDGSVQEQTDRYMKAHPGATFDEVDREILAPLEGGAVIRAISPRVFEAAGVGTAMINFPGRYSDVIEPWVHYIPLERDFANFDDVVSAVHDTAILEGLASRAHSDLVASGHYSLQTFVRGFDREIDARLSPVRRRRQSSVVGKLNRRLVALEHLRSPQRLGEQPLVASLRTRADERAARRLIHRFPNIEVLAHADLPTPRERLLHDLVRLSAAAAAHLRELRYLGPPFDVRLELDDKDRRLLMVGSAGPVEEVSGRDRLAERVTTTIRDGRLEEIIWDNSAVAARLILLTGPISSLSIGYHVIDGAHRFTALTELAHRDPEGVISALEPLFLERPDAPVRELHSRVVELLRRRRAG